MVTEKPPKRVSKTPKKSTSKKLPQKKLRLVKSNNKPKDILSLFNSTFPNAEPPDGFRVVNASQALWEFGIPVMEMAPSLDDASKTNELFNVVTAIWNYSLDDAPQQKQKISESDILALIQKQLGLNLIEARDVLSMMLERKHFLFPDKVQPKGSPRIFMRKTLCHLINRFNFENLEFIPEIIYPYKIDLKSFKDLERLDKYILRSADFSKYEKLFLKVQQELPERFYVWLGEKGLEEHRYTFAYLSDVYVNFIYGYSHEEPVTLKSGPGKYLVEFMIDFLITKTSVEPWEYTLCPASMKLFYTFLFEKLYLIDFPTVMIDMIDRIEPHLLEILRKTFS